jgi:hypothetical protein
MTNYRQQGVTENISKCHLDYRYNKMLAGSPPYLVWRDANLRRKGLERGAKKGGVYTKTRCLPKWKCAGIMSIGGFLILSIIGLLGCFFTHYGWPQALAVFFVALAGVAFLQAWLASKGGGWQSDVVSLLIYHFGEGWGLILSNAAAAVLLSAAFFFAATWLKLGEIHNLVTAETRAPDLISDGFMFLYYSVNTFVTFGGGDFEPTGVNRVVASGEAVLGALTMALFVFTFARRTADR